MKDAESLIRWARGYADELQSDMTFVAETPEGYGGFWTAADSQSRSRIMARAAAGLEFLREFAGAESEWLSRAKIAYESNADRRSMESGVHALGEIMRSWADQVEAGVTSVRGEAAAGVRSIASTDLMEQVRSLIQDKSIHAAAPVVLAGAALETALRGAVEEAGLVLAEKPGITAYGRALRTAEILSKQDMKDIEQMAGLRNSAAHGEFDELSRERAGLLEQQVNVFLSRLRTLMDG